MESPYKLKFDGDHRRGDRGPDLVDARLARGAVEDWSSRIDGPVSP